MKPISFLFVILWAGCGAQSNPPPPTIPPVGAIGSAPDPSVRARDLGVPFDGNPGPLNAITDVDGVEVGHVTLIHGDGPLVKGQGPVRTGVTAILPRGRRFDPVFAATYALNGNGEMTGIHADPEGGIWYTYPLVAETYDVLNDIFGQHVTRGHAFQALDAARPGPVTEGNVGGGTGMIAHGFKGGIGTSSRVTRDGHVVGVLVQANYGGRDRFTVAGLNAMVAARTMTGRDGLTAHALPHDRLRDALRKYGRLVE